ncbi:hypothetical protein GJ496_000437 [Pomphorhynchus laevis]|nr:hypothetical protein GJ496_000437 [Pomphorhynchus laevis]
MNYLKDNQENAMWLSVLVCLLNHLLTIKGILRVSNAKEDDNGQYFCSASNQYGTEFSSRTNVIVRGITQLNRELLQLKFQPSERQIPPRILFPPYNTTEIVEFGEVVILKCYSNGAPPPKTVWMRETPSTPLLEILDVFSIKATFQWKTRGSMPVQHFILQVFETGNTNKRDIELTIDGKIFRYTV